MKKAVIIGASSGMGMQLAKIMAKDAWSLGLTGRRTDLLHQLAEEVSGKTCGAAEVHRQRKPESTTDDGHVHHDLYVRSMDITHTQEAMQELRDLIDEMGGVDLIVISSGIGYLNHDFVWQLEQETIQTNVIGVTAMIHTAMAYFLHKKEGHLAVISSVAALRGSAVCPAYNASKAYISNYVEGMRGQAKKQKTAVTVTDIKPGLVDTAMAKGEGLFWVMPVEKAAKQIYKALLKKKDEAYITKRWRLVGWIVKLMPGFLYYKL